MARFSKPDIYLCGAAVIRGMRGQQSGCPIVSAECQHRCVSQNPRQIAVGIKIVSFSSFNHAVDYSTALRTVWCVCKQEVLPANHEWLYAAFCKVVAQLQAPIFQNADQIRPLLFQIVQSLAQRGLWSGLIRRSPCQQSVHYRFGPFQTLCISFFRRQCLQIGRASVGKECRL